MRHRLRPFARRKASGPSVLGFRWLLSLLALMVAFASLGGAPVPGSHAASGSLASQSASVPASQDLSTAFTAGATQPALSAATKRRVTNAYAKLPLAFIPNAGQTDKHVRYYAQGAGHSFYFTDHKAVLALVKGDHGEALQLRFLGANPNAKLTATDRASGRVNYFTGSERHTNLATYGRLVYRDLWPGIDMVFRGQGGKLNYEFRLRPGAKASDVRLAYAGADHVSLGAGGALLIETPLGTLRDAAPRSFQRIDGRRVAVKSHYALTGDTYGIAIGDHDRSRPLVIDPSLYSTYLGGNHNEAWTVGDIAVDAAGAAYVTGETESPDFPTTAGAFDTSCNCPGGNSFDAFVTKLNPAGSQLDYSTYLGGPGGATQGWGIAVDGAGAAYVTGETASANFPTTAGAFDKTRGGVRDAFVTKLNPAGTGLGYSTYLGGSSGDGSRSIAVGSAGAAYVTGGTASANFPTTAGAFDTSFNGAEAFVTKLNPAGSGLAYSTFLGGAGSNGIAVDSAGAAHLTGGAGSTGFPTTAGAFDTSFNGGQEDAFVTTLNPAGSGLSYSTYLGGSDADVGSAIAVDSAGTDHLTGFTDSTDFPTTAGAFDASFNGGQEDGFVTALNPAGSGLAYSTFLGGSSYDSPRGIAVDAAGAAYVTGGTASADFPTTAGAFDTSLNGFLDAFVAKLDPAGSGLVYSTYLGGSDYPTGSSSSDDDGSFGIAVDSTGDAYVTGGTNSRDFPTTAGAFGLTFNGGVYDAFVTKLSTTKLSTTNPTITGGPIGVTNDPTPTFTFISSTAGATFQCKLDDGAYSACHSPKTLAHLADGPHTFHVRAKDSEGNVQPNPASRRFTVRTAFVRVSGTALVVTAAPGASDNLQITRIPRPSTSTFQVTDFPSGAYTGSGVHTGAGCVRRGDYTAKCPASGITPALPALVTSAGHQADKVVNSSGLPSSLYGGAGDDLLVGGPARDLLNGGAGVDVLQGLDGNDLLQAHDGTSDKTIDCGPGSDKADLDLLPKDPNVKGCESKMRH
jgi:hypothetical protein